MRRGAIRLLIVVIHPDPVAIGQGLSIFRETTPLQLESHTAYKNGKMVLKYLPARKELLPAK